MVETYKLPPKKETHKGRMGTGKSPKKKDRRWKLKQRYATGGSVSRGQYASQPNKVKFKGVF